MTKNKPSHEDFSLDELKNDASRIETITDELFSFFDKYDSGDDHVFYCVESKIRTLIGEKILNDR